MKEYQGNEALGLNPTLHCPARLSPEMTAKVQEIAVRALGLETFGQSGDLPDLYAKYRLDADAILDACADLMV